MSTNIERLNSYLKEQELRVARALGEIYNTNEYKRYLQEVDILEDIKASIKREETAQLEINKEKLIKLGFECRTGHEIGSTNDETSIDGSDYRYVIVHSSKKRILSILKRTYSISVQWEGIEERNGGWGWILGAGASEKEAWITALYNAEDKGVLEAAING
ncbi:hypothetical protein H6G33_09910 [Calothrix sp. FACHB-1219]|uniref:hypothetical protein n=1 Tax=unclassified Calothrix TaxID=2619626 RepID=UPI001684AB0F|nr:MULTISPECIES: hypothetical protein [unclassified Calothrix]MBD2201661.1 hypothetical protein [Calothrix sp. FACHB-168]MBD2217347.1 hypothetical protein [Calothrix sp. FACHB-1219]